MTGKVVVITGASSGIGREAAVDLAHCGATVVMTARDELRGRDALGYVRDRSGAAERVALMELDLASFGSVRAFAAGLLDCHERLDVLVNNAGGILSTRRETDDGFEMTFGVNHLGHFYLTELLLERLRSTAPARIVNVSSIGHRYGTMRWGDLQHSDRYVGTTAYNQSKLANVLFTLELARRLDPAEVTANCCHPGPVRSGFASAEDTRGIERLVILLARPFMVSPSRGARPIIELASSPEFAGVSGRYVVGGYVPGVHQHRPSREARDADAGSRLWAMSEQYVRDAITEGDR